MATSARAITPTHTGTFAAAPVAPDTPTSLASSVAAQSASVATAKDAVQLAPLVAVANLRDSASPKSTRFPLSRGASPIPLTGAAALAEQREMREKRKRSVELEDQSQQMSPNPGVAAVQTLLGNQMSSAKDAPPAVTKMSSPLEKAAKNIKIPENGVQDPAQTSPISMSSLGSLDVTTAATVTASEVTAGPPNLSNAAHGDGHAPPSMQQQDSNASGANDGPRAFTFPPPLDQDPRSTPQRGLSLPNPYAQQHSTPSSTRSPSITGSGSSAKRHKCPYCSTDFTRHHNLKSHLLTHSQEKPYECKECNARFRRLHDLKRHTKLHTGERPHTCPKCGRRFARGDALARHNKGSGGCAGRRSSFGAPGMGEDGADGEGMDGLEYSTHQTEEPERMDEDEAMGEAGDRRRSEPSREGNLRRAPTASTYPPIQGGPPGGVGRDAVRGMYPPPSGASTTHSSYRDSGPQPSHQGTGSSGSHGPSPLHFPPDSARQVFSHSSMTESPKPLSPGQDPNRGPYSSFPRPSGSSSLQAYPPNSNAPTLPSLPGLSSMPAPPPIGSGSNPGSHSSHGASSGGSIREVLSGGSQQGGPASSQIYDVIRELEVRMARMQEEYEARISSLQQEVSMLRDHHARASQPPPPHVPQQQPPSGPAPPAQPR